MRISAAQATNYPHPARMASSVRPKGPELSGLYFLKQQAQHAYNWLLSSGIQDKRSGAVFSWFDPEQNRYAFIYPEIMGYFITEQCYLESFSEIFGPLCLSAARSAADWLIKYGFDSSGGVLPIFSVEGRPESFGTFGRSHIFTFDNGIIMNGFLNLYRRTDEPAYLDAAKTVASFLLKNTLRPGKKIMPLYCLGTGLPEEDPPHWSRSAGPFLAKTAIAFLNLHDLTKDPAYLSAARSLCDNAKRFQSKDGRTFSPDGTTYMHGHCYAAEGLLVSGLLLKDEAFFSAGLSAVNWFLSRVKEEGSVRRWYNGPSEARPKSFSSDIQAQALRLLLLAAGASGNDRFRDPKAVSGLLSTLLYYQAERPADKRVLGGFYYGTDPSSGRGIVNVNSWCTMFALQAMEMLIKKEADLELFDLV